MTQPVSGTVTANQGSPPWQVVGNVASGAADSGNPVKVGGVFNSTLPTLTTGQRGDLQLDASGRVLVAQPTASALNATVSGTVTANQGGTWTVQPGNTANTTPWLANTQAISSTGSAAPTNADLQGELASGNLIGHIGCDKSVVINAATSGSTQLVALVSGQVIYVCGYNFMAGGTANVKLLYGTGTNCGTGATDLTGPYPLIAQTGVSYGNGEGTVFRTASANALCVNLSAAVQVSGVVTYTQF